MFKKDILSSIQKKFPKGFNQYLPSRLKKLSSYFSWKDMNEKGRAKRESSSIANITSDHFLAHFKTFETMDFKGDLFLRLIVPILGIFCRWGFWLLGLTGQPWIWPRSPAWRQSRWWSRPTESPARKGIYEIYNIIHWQISQSYFRLHYLLLITPTQPASQHKYKLYL